MPATLLGVLLCATGALLWSTGGLAVRLLSVDGWTASFWRSAIMAAAVFLWLLLRHGRGTWSEFRRIGRPGVLLALSYSTTFIFFILALQHTTVANTVVIMSATPLFGGAAAWILLGEPMGRATIGLMLAACAGIALMVADSLAAGHLLGDLLALGVAITQAGNVVIMRRGRAVSMVPALSLAGAISALAALPFAAPLAATGQDLAVLGFLGTVQLGAGLVLFSTGVRHVPVAVAGLLSLLETVLAPLWAWLGVGERPSDLALVGGGIVVGALAGQAWLSGRRASEKA